MKLTFAAKRTTPCERVLKIVPELVSFLMYHFVSCHLGFLKDVWYLASSCNLPSLGLSFSPHLTRMCQRSLLLMYPFPAGSMPLKASVNSFETFSLVECWCITSKKSANDNFPFFDLLREAYFLLLFQLGLS